MNLSFFGSDFEWMGNEKALAVNSNCLLVLQKIEDHSIDLIFVDPPYGLGKDYGEQVTDSFANSQEYFTWAKQWIDECMRVLKFDGTMYIMNSTQNMPLIDAYCSEKYFVINRIIWTYDSSGTQSKRKFGSLYEPILMITHSAKSNYTFNSNDILIEAKTGANRNLIDYRKTPPRPYNKLKVPGNVWNFNRVRFKMDEYENHPTQKPKVLLKRIIKASSNSNDIVLDPFAGSFTTCEVALELNRNTIGIELNLDYFKIGLRRTGICEVFKGEKLVKDLSRKTKNKSKFDHSKEELKEVDSILQKHKRKKQHKKTGNLFANLDENLNSETLSFDASKD